MRCFGIVITIFILWLTDAGSNDPKISRLGLDEFLAREDLMQLQINLWELIGQLEYTQGNQRLRVYTDIQDVQREMADRVATILELDLLYHDPDKK